MEDNLSYKLRLAFEKMDLDLFKEVIYDLPKEIKIKEVNIMLGNAIKLMAKPEIIGFLIASGGDTNYHDPNNADPEKIEKGLNCGNMLHCLIASCYDYFCDGLTTPYFEEQMKLLIDNNVNVNSINDSNLTPLDLAINFKNAIAIQILKNKGAKTFIELKGSNDLNPEKRTC